MNPQNINRGHETEEHQRLKARLIQFLKRWGFALVLAEHQNNDVIAVRPLGDTILGGEVERSVRNLMNNCARCFATGCTHVLILAPDFKTTGEIARKLDQGLPSKYRKNVGIITASALQMIAPPQPQNGGRK